MAKGHFEAIDLPASRDETRDVVKALNRMIVELDKRQNQLLQEKKLASLGVLTSGIAHQLNNPLTTSPPPARYFARRTSAKTTPS